MSATTIELITEGLRRQRLVEGCKKIDAELGAAVETAFKAGYSVEQVHAILSAGKAMADGPEGEAI